MIRRLHPTVEYILEERYKNKILVEKEELALSDDSRKKGKSPSNVREKFGQALMDVSDALGYTELANENIPGVKGMAQVEVPLAKTDQKAYQQARSELAKKIVEARKKAFDEWRENKRENRELAPDEELLAAIASAPALVDVLTRDEYELLAGDITNPLNIEVPVKVKAVDSEGNETEAERLETLSREKWGGIEGGSAALYDFLRGAQESLTTPEGLAMTAAGGAVFKGAGALLGVGGKYVVSPLVARTLGKAAAKALPSAQKVTNLAGLGLVGLGLANAAEEGKVARFAGELAGGVAPFAAGREGAGLVGKAAKEAAVEGGKAAGKAAVKVARPIADIATDFVETQRSPQGFVGQAKELPTWLKNMLSGERIHRSRVNTSGEPFAIWKGGEGTRSPDQPFEPNVAPGQSPRTSREAPPSLAKKLGITTTAAAALSLAAGEPVRQSVVDFSPKTQIVATEVTPPLESKPTSTRTRSGGSNPPAESKTAESRTPVAEPKTQESKSTTEKSKDSSRTSFGSKSKLVKTETIDSKIPNLKKPVPSQPGPTLPDTTITNNYPTTTDTTTNTITDTTTSTRDNVGGKDGKGGKEGKEGKEGKKGKDGKTPGGGLPLPSDFGGYDGGGSIIDDHMRNLRTQADINAYIDRFYNTAQTIRLQ